MSKLLAETIPLALAAAISPVVFLLQLATLSGERRLARGTAVAAGAAVPLVAVGLFAVFVGRSESFSPSETTKAVIDLVLGLVLVFGVGLRALRSSPSTKEESHPKRHEAGMRGSFMLGLAAMTTNVTTFAFYIPAMRFVALSDVSYTEQALAAFLVLAITLAAVLFPLGLTAIAPDRSGRVLDALARWLSGHSRRNQIVLGFGLGAWLVVKGIGGL